MSERLTENFLASEFRCACGRPDCDAPRMDRAFMAKLQALRTAWGRPMVITSGARCRAHNAAIGGSVGSMHLRGLAADVSMHPGKARWEFLRLAFALGFRGIGVGRSFVHLDMRPEPLDEAVWIY